MIQHLEALKLSVSIAQFAVQERYKELTNNNTHLRFERIRDYENHAALVNIEDWENMHKVHWDTYLKASDSYILSLNSQKS